MRNTISQYAGRVMVAPFNMVGDPVLAAARAQTVARIGNVARPTSWPYQATTRPRRSAKRSANLSTADAKAILNRLEHRRTLSAMDRIVAKSATATPRTLSLTGAKRILASVEARNLKRGIEPRRQVVTIPVALDSRLR